MMATFGVGQRDLDRHRIDDRHGLHRRQVGGHRRSLDALGPVEVGLDRLGVERGAVVERDALAHVQRQRQAVVAELPRLGQAGDQVALGRQVHEAVVDREQRRGVLADRGLVRVQAAHGDRVAVDERGVEVRLALGLLDARRGRVGRLGASVDAVVSVGAASVSPVVGLGSGRHPGIRRRRVVGGDRDVGRAGRLGAVGGDVVVVTTAGGGDGQQAGERHDGQRPSGTRADHGPGTPIAIPPTSPPGRNLTTGRDVIADRSGADVRRPGSSCRGSPSARGRAAAPWRRGRRTGRRPTARRGRCGRRPGS